MPTVTKISLDAEEYKRDLADVIGRTREARRAMEGGQVGQVGQVGQGGQGGQVGQVGQGAEVVVSADTAPAEAALEKLTGQPVYIEAKVVADTKEIESLKSAITSLEKKSVEIRTEVNSEALDQLRGKLDVTNGKASGFGVALRGMMQGNIGEQIGKGATAIGALGSVAGASVPPVGALAAVVNALVAPLALVTAALAALVAIGVNVWDRLTVSAEEYAEKTKIASENAQKELEKTRESSVAAQGYIDRLRELNSIENSGNSTKAETAQLLEALRNRYGDLGEEIDTTTGKVTNLLEVEERLNAVRNKKTADKHQQASDANMNEAKSAYMKVKGSEWGITEGAAGRLFDTHRKSLPLEQMIKMMDQASANATSQSDITGYGEVAAKLRAALEARNKGRSVASNGYESEDEYNKALQQKLAAQGAAQRGRDGVVRASGERRSDDRFSDLKDIDAKKANRQERIAEESLRRDGTGGLQSQLEEAKKRVGKAAESGNATGKADALKQQYELERQIQESLDREYSLKRQMEGLDKARSEAVEKLTNQAKYELEYNNLILAGEFEKASALKLEKELKDQNLKLSEEEKQVILEQRDALQHQDTAKQIAEAKEEVALQQLLVNGNYDAYEAEKLRLEAKRQGKKLTEEETKAILEQRKAQGGLNLKKSLQDQAYGVYDGAMKMNGFGRQAERESALRNAEKTKGGKLTEEETTQVTELTDLKFKMDNMQKPELGDLSVKTNSLTSRGGFAGGVAAPDTAAATRQIRDYAKRQMELLTQIQTIVATMRTSVEDGNKV